MSNSLPPQDLLDKLDLLRKEVEDEKSKIANYKEKIAESEKRIAERDVKLAAYYLILKEDFAWNGAATSTKISPLIKKSGARILYQAEYETILLPFLEAKKTATRGELRARMSEAVGFEVTDDALTKGIRKIIDSGYPISRIRPGVFVYDSSKVF